MNIDTIEKNSNVENISWKGSNLWPLFKPHLYNALNKNSLKTPRKDIYKVFRFVKSFFLFFPKLFTIHRFNYWIISNANRRILINGEWVSRLSEGIYEYFEGDVIMIETNLTEDHKKNTRSKHILSEGLLMFLQIPVFFYFKLKKPSFKGEEIIKQILKDFDVKYDYKERFYRFLAQYYTFKWLLKRKKPGKVFIECYYDYTGYIRAIKEKKIPVIEIQHGIINKSHRAYHFDKSFNKDLFPDYLFSFGEFEKQFFKNNNTNFIAFNNVYPVGYYIIEYYLEKSAENKYLSKIAKGFEQKIVISGQNHLEDKMIPFLNSAAEKEKDMLFVYVPRNKGKLPNYRFKCKNIICINTLPIYELISWADVHATIYSTTAIEALALGKPTLFLDFEGLSTYHFGYLKEKYGVAFCNGVQDFKRAISKIMVEQTPREIKMQVNNHFISRFSTNFEKALKFITN